MKLHRFMLMTIALLAFGGCSKSGNDTNGIKDATDSRPNEGIRDAGEDIKQGVDDAAQDIKKDAE